MGWAPPLFILTVLGFLVFFYVASGYFGPLKPKMRYMVMPYALLLIALYGGVARMPLFRGDRPVSGFGGLWATRFAVALAMSAGLVILSHTAWGGAASVREARDEGLGWVGPGWTDSAMLEDLRNLPPGTVVFSNVPDGVRLHTGIDAEWSPRDPGDTPESRERFERDLRKMLKLIGEGQGVLALSRLKRTSAFANPKEIDTEVDLWTMQSYPEGWLYLVRGVENEPTWREWIEQRRELAPEGRGLRR
jgi:hypothetical protein